MHQSRENKPQTFCAEPMLLWKEKSKKAGKGKKSYPYLIYLQNDTLFPIRQNPTAYTD